MIVACFCGISFSMREDVAVCPECGRLATAPHARQINNPEEALRRWTLEAEAAAGTLEEIEP